MICNVSRPTNSRVFWMILAHFALKSPTHTFLPKYHTISLFLHLILQLLTQFYFIEHMEAFYHLWGDYFLAKNEEYNCYWHSSKAILYNLVSSERSSRWWISQCWQVSVWLNSAVFAICNSPRNIHDFLITKRFFSTEAQCCLNFSWIELKCCLGVT